MVVLSGTQKIAVVLINGTNYLCEENKQLLNKYYVDYKSKLSRLLTYCRMRRQIPIINKILTSYVCFCTMSIPKQIAKINIC